MRAAEVGRRGILADLHDAAADRAGAAEVFEQRIAIAAPHRARELRQVFAELRQHFQHGVLVVQEHVAPHRRVGSRDAREIAQAAGRELQHLGARAPPGMRTMTSAASLAAAAFVSTTRSAMPSSTMRRRVASLRAVATISRTTPYSRAARAIEPPISPTPISARRSMRGEELLDTRLSACTERRLPPRSGGEGEGGGGWCRGRCCPKRGPPPPIPP